MDFGSYSLSTTESTINGTHLPQPVVGTVNIYIWRGLCGSDIANLRKSLFFPRYPVENFKQPVTVFQIEDNTIDYGRLIFGFVHPPSSSSYRFAIVSDDASELWLSSTEDPNEKQLIARVFKKGAIAWTKENQSNKYPDQISSKVNLSKGSKYYVEVLHKQSAGKGFVQVFWKSLQDKDFKLISSEYLSTYSDDIRVSKKNKDVLHRLLSDRHLYKLEQKSKRISKEYLKFFSLPLIPKDSYLPSCDYKSSFVLDRGIYKYEGVNYVSYSKVYPEDNTNGMAWPNRVAHRDLIQTVADMITTSLRVKTFK